MNEQICGLCALPVSMKADRADDRKPDPDLKGRWVHASCANPTPEQRLISEIFGQPLGAIRRAALANEATKDGHVITIEKEHGQRRWVCTCGDYSVWHGLPKGGWHTLQGCADEHLRMAILLASS
jgi:hypothetical protein